MRGEERVKLAGEQWAGAQAEQLDRLEMFVCHFSDCLRMFCIWDSVLLDHLGIVDRLICGGDDDNWMLFELDNLTTWQLDNIESSSPCHCARAHHLWAGCDLGKWWNSLQQIRLQSCRRATCYILFRRITHLIFSINPCLTSWWYCFWSESPGSCSCWRCVVLFKWLKCYCNFS